jgi:hypothetical protein
MKIINFVKSIKYELTVFIFFVVGRLPLLGYDTFNTDVWKWKARIYDFGSGVFNLHFIQTIQKYHPGVTLLWIGTFAVKVYNFYYESILGKLPVDNSFVTVFELNFVQKLFVVITIALVMAAIFYPLRKMFGLRYALIAAALIGLEPFYFALTREIHLEGLMSAFMLASFVWLYFYLKNPVRRRYLIISGVFTGLAVLTKTSSLFMLPFMGIVIFLWNYLSERHFWSSVKFSISVYGKWLLAAVLTFIIIWPAMWTYPLLALQTLLKGIYDVGVEGGHEQFFFAKYTLDPGYFYYLVVFALRSSVYLLAGLIGYLIFRKKMESEHRKFSFYAALFAISYIIFLSIPSKKLDRYIVPAFLGFLPVAAFFYNYLFEKIKKYIVLIPLFLFLPIFTLVWIQPDYFSYYNPLFGGLRTGVKVIEPKWMIGVPEIVAYFSNIKSEGNYVNSPDLESFDAILKTPRVNSELVVGFQEKYYTQIWPFFRKIGAWAVIADIRDLAVKADYFVYPYWDDSALTETRFKLEYVGKIKVRGVDVYNVYRSTTENK